MTSVAEPIPHAECHLVGFYAGDFDLVAAATDYLGPALRVVNGGVVVVATAEHNQSIDAAMRIAGIDTTAAMAAGRLTFVDAADLLAQFSTPGGLDGAEFDRLVGGLLERAAKPGRKLRVFGEMVALLWNNGEVATAMELEQMWNALQARVPFGLLCGYPGGHRTGARRSARTQADIDKVSGLHTGVWQGNTTRIETKTFGADITAPFLARAFVADTLRAWNCDRLLDDALLVVSELATNAVIHGRADFTVRLQRADERVRIAVYDGADTAPIQIEAPALATGGRGLALVDSVSSGWGCEQAEVGKTVWADLPA